MTNSDLSNQSHLETNSGGWLTQRYILSAIILAVYPISAFGGTYAKSKL
jgi:hypothetical protein